MTAGDADGEGEGEERARAVFGSVGTTRVVCDSADKVHFVAAMVDVRNERVGAEAMPRAVVHLQH